MLKVLAFFQMLSGTGQREIERVVDASQEVQKVLGGRVPRNTLQIIFQILTPCEARAALTGRVEAAPQPYVSLKSDHLFNPISHRNLTLLLHVWMQ
jgi:hypothetical protein